MSYNNHLLLILLCVLVLCLPGNGVYAFGAGNIPSFAYMEGRAFRHGDIEDALNELAKKAAGGFALGALIGKGGSKFHGLDVKRVYFGNWLRDYSQAVDVAGLQKLPLQTIINLVMVLGFMAHGYVTHEFEVTVERLGVYLPTEHIDNPKGYPENARTFDQRLRGPVDPRELEIDPRTGMKNYIANENGNWDTSKAVVRRTLERCIQVGRQHRAQGRKEDEYEAYRLLGQALHTLEDFSAHSNFCELALVSMGHQEVFVHVGDQVRIQAQNGRWVAPLVTGTFGSSDFIHSLLGEATDHISQASVTDLNAQLDKARSKSGPGGPGTTSPYDVIRDLIFKIPGGDKGEMQRELDSVNRIRAEPTQPGGRRPEDMSPQELHAVLWQVLTFRDSVMKKISKTIDRIPGLDSMLEKLSDSISVFVFTTLEPFLKPLMKQATSGLMLASGEVINNNDQYEVFNDPRASDPTHSFLSKDHFNLILNEPAGHLSRIVLIYTVKRVVKAWDDQSVHVNQITEDVLQCLFHPDFHNSNSEIQREMMQYMHSWVQGLGGRQHDVLQRLTKEAVREHKNIRAAGEGGPPAAQGSYAQNAGVEAQHDISGYLHGVPGVAQAESLMGKVGQFSSGVSNVGQMFNMVSPGGRRESPSDTVGGQGYQPHRHGSYNGPPPPTSGHAASYYSESQTITTPVQTQTSSYSSYTSTYPGSPQSSYPGGPPAFPSDSAPPPPPRPQYGQPAAPPSFPPDSGYAPSYGNQPAFPSTGPGPGFPEQPPYGGGGPGYGAYPPYPPPGGPGFPDAQAPQFPGGPGGGYPPPGGYYGGPPQPDPRYGGGY